MIPTSTTCPYQAVSNGCFAVPPTPINCLSDLKCNPAFDGSIDGVRSPHEYDGATVLPYTDLRYDAEAYVRPAYQSDAPKFQAAKWMVEKDTSQPQWRSPYPGPAPIGNQFSGPPQRLSDHKPVLAGLDFAKLVVPPRFHPKWKHSVEFRVVSADASNVDDCAGCSTVDPKVENWGGHVPLGGGWVEEKHGDLSHFCQNHASVSWPADGCMDNWNWPNVAHDGKEQAQAYGSFLLDDDSTSGDDAMPLHNLGTQPVIWITWSSPAVLVLRGWDFQNLGTQDWTVNDTAPIAISTITPAAGGPTSQTLQFKAVELPPDKQF